MKKETKSLILGTAMAGLFAAGVTAARIAPAFADDAAPAGGDAKADMGSKGKNGCKGSCKSKNGCKGKKHKHKHSKKEKPADAPAAGADAPKSE